MNFSKRLSIITSSVIESFQPGADKEKEKNHWYFLYPLSFFLNFPSLFFVCSVVLFGVFFGGGGLIFVIVILKRLKILLTLFWTDKNDQWNRRMIILSLSLSLSLSLPLSFQKHNIILKLSFPVFIFVLLVGEGLFLLSWY